MGHHGVHCLMLIANTLGIVDAISMYTRSCANPVETHKHCYWLEKHCTEHTTKVDFWLWAHNVWNVLPCHIRRQSLGNWARWTDWDLSRVLFLNKWLSSLQHVCSVRRSVEKLYFQKKDYIYCRYSRTLDSTKWFLKEEAHWLPAAATKCLMQVWTAVKEEKRTYTDCRKFHKRSYIGVFINVSKPGTLLESTLHIHCFALAVQKTIKTLLALDLVVWAYVSSHCYS